MKNPPAFPVLGKSGLLAEGMTLRDYFAAAALAMLANSTLRRTDGDGPLSVSNVANAVYEIADAMLAERAKP